MPKIQNFFRLYFPCIRREWKHGLLGDLDFDVDVSQPKHVDVSNPNGIILLVLFLLFSFFGFFLISQTSFKQ